MSHRKAATAAATGLACVGLALCAPLALAGAEGPGTPQATYANATFLSSLPAPPGGAAAVCVIDSGVDADTDLGPALVGRTSTVGGLGGNPDDLGATSDVGVQLPKHGTYVAGVIASQVDGVGTSGIWPAARIYSARVFGGGASAKVSDYIEAIAWCGNQSNVKVINLSLSGLAEASVAQRASLDNKIAEYRAAPYGINVVAAVGNNGALSAGYPATAPGVLGVGATDSTGALAAFSNRGDGLDLSTFGTDTCISTGAGSHLGRGAGTSYAAPLVSAVLAAMRSYDTSLTPDQAEQLLLEHSERINGFKVLNAAETFRAHARLSSLVGDSPIRGVDAIVKNPCEWSPGVDPV